MQDFLEYMRTLEVWQEENSQPKPQFSATLFLAHVDCLQSPLEISNYAREHAILQHSWLVGFQNARYSRNHLKIWLRQRYLISWCFPNWLMAIAAKLPTPGTRIPLLINLYEEHGLVPDKGHSKPHPEMWQQLFEELQAVETGTPLPLPASAAELLPGTQSYLQLYTTACFEYPTPFGLGVLAFTESILPYENKLILAGLRRLGISSAGQEFFAVHCECDKAHAEEIIKVIDQIADSPQRLWEVWQGVEIAVRARKAFYDSLCSVECDTSKQKDVVH
ncbi:MAG: TenA family transcriptional regulator [Xenococcaceae cyanobacterium]